MAEIAWTLEAQRWLEDIFEYIAADNPPGLKPSQMPNVVPASSATSNRSMKRMMVAVTAPPSDVKRKS